jgi:hypothetical protein
MEDNEKRVQTRADRQNEEMVERVKKLAKFRGNESIYDLVGYVYRETLGQKRTALPPVDAFLEDNELGLMYGPGKYLVVYKFIDPLNEDKESTQQCTTISYSIGAEYASLHRQHCLENGLHCYLDSRAVAPGMQQQENGFSSLLSEDKMKGIIGLLGAVKMLLGNDDRGGIYRDQLDNQTKLLQAVLTNKSAPAGGFSESIVNSAMNRLLDGPAQVNPSKVLMDQLDIFERFDAMRNPQAAQVRREEEEERNMSPLDKLIGKAMDFLPVFLERFNGDEKAAAIQLKKEHPEAKIMLASPKMRQQFYESVCREYGKLSADRWALGLGIDPSTLRAPSGPVAVAQASEPVQPQSGVKFR